MVCFFRQRNKVFSKAALLGGYMSQRVIIGLISEILVLNEVRSD